MGRSLSSSRPLLPPSRSMVMGSLGNRMGLGLAVYHSLLGTSQFPSLHKGLKTPEGLSPARLIFHFPQPCFHRDCFLLRTLKNTVCVKHKLGNQATSPGARLPEPIFPGVLSSESTKVCSQRAHAVVGRQCWPPLSSPSSRPIIWERWSLHLLLNDL